MQSLQRTVQGLWIGSKLSQIELACISSFLSNGHAFHLYAYQQFDHLPNGCTWKDANEIIPEQDIFTYEKGPGKGSYAAFANLFRYKLLFERGGWWSDMDVICIKPLPSPARMFIAAEWKPQPSRWSGAIRTRLTRLERFGLSLEWFKSLINKKKLNNNLLFCLPGEKLMEKAFAIAFKAKNNELNWGETGPNLMNRLIDDHGFLQTTDIGDPSFFQPIAAYQLELFFDPNARPPVDQAITLHLYNELWRRMGKSKDGPFPEGSLIQRLVNPRND